MCRVFLNRIAHSVEREVVGDLVAAKREFVDEETEAMRFQHTDVGRCWIASG